MESNSIAQMRAAAVLVDTVVHHAATVKYRDGGKKGLHIDQDDPIGSFRAYFDENRMKLEQAVFRALAPSTDIFVCAEMLYGHSLKPRSCSILSFMGL